MNLATDGAENVSGVDNKLYAKTGLVEGYFLNKMTPNIMGFFYVTVTPNIMGLFLCDRDP